MRAAPNVLHATLCLNELLGRRIEMRRVPVIAGGRAVRKPDGEVGVIFEHAPEAQAFARWQRGEFGEVERLFARQWRDQISASDHGATAKLARRTLTIRDVPKNLDDAIAIARDVVFGSGQRFLTLRTAYALLGLPAVAFDQVQQRWKLLGGPPLVQFAPYTAHCLLVDVFFHVCIDKKLISPDRPTNRIDIAYLYYLPFVMMFASNDKLHARIAPLFMGEEQAFIWGGDLKTDLGRLDAHFSASAADVEKEGLFRVAGYPPDDETFLTTRLWRRFGMPTRPAPEERDPDALPKPTVEKLLAMVDQMKEAAKQTPRGRFAQSEIDDPNHMVIERHVPLWRGKWRLLPAGVEAKQ
jgi:hypothetical protein